MIDIKEFLGEQANDLNYLTDEDYKHSINALVDDENEAISGYDRVIQLFKNFFISFYFITTNIFNI